MVRHRKTKIMLIEIFLLLNN